MMCAVPDAAKCQRCEPPRCEVYYKGGGGGFAPSQIRGGKFRGALWILCGSPRQSPQCVLLVCEKFAENPEFRVGSFVVNLKRSISHANLKRHEIPPPTVNEWYPHV